MENKAATIVTLMRRKIDYMKSDSTLGFSAQFAALWHHFRAYQKAIIGIFIVLVAALISYSWIISQEEFVLLYPPERLTASELSEIDNYLNGQGISHKIQDGHLLVEPESVHRVRMDLAAFAIPKAQSSKGYELFDSNAWIRGEKEVQIVELRALKEQLEKDISQYENIDVATVNLDIAPPRLIGAATYHAKATVTLSLKPGARLTPSQLRAITFHVSGAIRGLTPNMVAILDTKGRLYQGIDVEGVEGSISNTELIIEEQLKRNIDAILNEAVGATHYYSSVQVAVKYLSNGQQTIENVAVNTLLNKNAFYPAIIDGPDNKPVVKAQDVELFKSKIEKQLREVLKDYDPHVTQTVDILPFEAPKQPPVWTKWKETDILYLTAGSLLLFIIVLAWIFALLNRTQEEQASPKEEASKEEEILVSEIQELPLTEVSKQEEIFVELPKEEPVVKVPESVFVKPDQKVMVEHIQNLMKNDPDQFVLALREWIYASK